MPPPTPYTPWSLSSPLQTVVVRYPPQRPFVTELNYMIGCPPPASLSPVQRVRFFFVPGGHGHRRSRGNLRDVFPGLDPTEPSPSSLSGLDPTDGSRP